MSMLVHAEVDGDRLDDDALIHESLLILIGGDETTRHVITGGMYQLLADPDQWTRLPADPGPLPDRGRGDAALGVADQEHGPHRHPRRRARRPADRTRARSSCCSTRRPTATRTCSTTRSASTSTAHPNDHVAFGFGTHFCLGNSLGPARAAA